MDELAIKKSIKNVKMNGLERDSIVATLKGLKFEDFGKSRFDKGIVYVTDLLNPKRAFFKEKYPRETSIPLEKKEKMWIGEDFHYDFGQIVASREFLENDIDKENIFGRVDIFKDTIIETKWTGKNFPGDVKIALARPSYVEQLAIYCAMCEKKLGWIACYIASKDSMVSGELRVYEIRFKQLNEIWNEALLRKELLIKAWETNDSSILPACPWYDWECEAKNVCDCKTTKTKFEYDILQYIDDERRLYDEEERLGKLFRDYLKRPRLLMSLWNLLSPKYYCLSLDKTNDDGINNYLPDDVTYTRKNLRKGIIDAIKRTAKKDFETIYLPANGLNLPVLLYNDIPTVIAVKEYYGCPVERTKLWKEGWGLANELRILGMSCALHNSKIGKIFAYFGKAKEDLLKIGVYTVEFEDTSEYLVYLENTIDGIRTARESCDYSKLKCPDWNWMVKYGCEYKGRKCKMWDRCKGVE